ncbi:PREDICTED: uncharacterized protein LOC109150225 [Ipomoea nil]|uniref:uncharacterized protein LOC109150225 n=1 Tax=Ipomoea nil TaxID=35883 RepID=UPI0009010D8F|nr:PREDICTED: uncharacterized protein LOC109150225 [Ipomoea nil]
MDPAASQPHQTTTTTATTTAISQIQYPESTNSSPRSRQTETWDEPLPPVPGAKLRLMCSYGGHIIPRPHDKSLCYVGGDTRIVVVDRSSSLAELHSRLSHTLLNGRHFTLKYQLPTEELDSLISVTTEEDLENMVEEYDRTVSTSPLRPSRLRLFLFLSKPETAASMGCLLADAKSETWFVDALNNAGLLSRGLSDSATENNNIVDLDGMMIQSDSATDLQKNHHQNSSSDNKQYTVPDSPVVIETSSFDSSTVSSPSMANLPPIKVRVEGGGLRVNDKIFGLEEQLSQINVGPQTTQKQEDGVDNNVAATAAVPPTIFAINSAVISDYEKLDDGAQPGIRKPPLPLQLVPRKTGDGYGLSSPDSRHAAGGFNLASPDSVASDSSITSAASFSKHATNQDATQAIISRENRAAIDPKSNIMDTTTSLIQMHHQGQDSAAAIQHNQQQQPQFIHPNTTHYFQHPPAGGGGPVPISSYYPMYTGAAPPSQQQMDHQHQHQQYPMYLLPVTQPYNNFAAAPPSSTPPPNPTTNNAYKEALPPIYPTKPAPPSSKPEAAAASVYRTGAAITPALQFHQQFFGLSSQAPPPPSSANYGYDYSHIPTQDQQLYYAHQHQVAPLPSQYQTMTPTTALLLSQAAENAMQQPKTSQPL